MTYYLFDIELFVLEFVIRNNTDWKNIKLELGYRAIIKKIKVIFNITFKCVALNEKSYKIFPE